MIYNCHPPDAYTHIKRSILMRIKTYTLYKSSNSAKKYDVYVINPKTHRIKKISFGAKGYSDYTIHKDKERRQRYRTRHIKDKIKNPLYAGFWSMWILWGQYTDIKKCLRWTLKKYKLIPQVIDYAR